MAGVGLKVCNLIFLNIDVYILMEMNLFSVENYSCGVNSENLSLPLHAFKNNHPLFFENGVVIRSG